MRWIRSQSKRSSSFLKKRTKKTFITIARAAGEARDSDIKVFWFRKERLPCLPPQPCQTGCMSAPLLKDIFDATLIRHIGAETQAVFPAFDRKAFVAATLRGLEPLSVMQRLRHVTENLHVLLPEDYASALAILRKLAPRLNSRFVAMVLPEYAALYGQADFALSMAALRDFTIYGSSEFGIRPFLRHDQARTLRQMTKWAVDPDEHVRRLASEGSRPRLPWSFQLECLRADPSPVLPILIRLKSDPSAYVRKSVANHLNDITKDHPDWVLSLIESWPTDDARTNWIAKHALRSLIKQGNQRALAVIGADAKPALEVQSFDVQPWIVTRGDTITLSVTLVSTARVPQRLAVDYAVHYVKRSGNAAPKVFKLKLLSLAPNDRVTLSRSQVIRDFTTRTHYAGEHEMELFVNGVSMARTAFMLRE